VQTQTELLLVEQLRGGDAAALEALMDRYAPRVYRLAYGITRDEMDAEEVVQDVFLSVFRKIHAFEGRSSLGTWIYRVATNAALLRRRGKRAHVEVHLEDYLPTFREDGHREDDRGVLLMDWSQSPEEEFLTRETREVVRRAIDTLPGGLKPFYKTHRLEIPSLSLEPSLPQEGLERRFAIDRLLPFPFAEFPRAEAAAQARFGDALPEEQLARYQELVERFGEPVEPGCWKGGAARPRR